MPTDTPVFTPDVARAMETLDAPTQVAKPNLKPFSYDGQFGLSLAQCKAAWYDADGSYTIHQIAQNTGAAAKNIAKWRLGTKYRCQVARFQADIRDAVKEFGISEKVGRLTRLERYAAKLESVHDAREASKSRQKRAKKMPEAASGAYAEIKRGKAVFYEFDGQLDRAYRGTLEQVAKEQGGGFEKEAQHNTVVPVLVMMPEPTAITPRKIKALDGAVMLAITK